MAIFSSIHTVLVVLFGAIYLYSQMSVVKPSSPVVVVGSGLAGLTSVFHLLQQNRPVILLEKSKNIGGNSIKASSGINGVLTSTQKVQNVTDSREWFLSDVVKSAKELGDLELQKILVNESTGIIEWLKRDIGVDLDVINRLGGHSSKRTHRSDGKSPGFEIVSKLKQSVVNDENLTVLMNSKVISIDVNKDKKVQGILYIDTESSEERYLKTDNVIMATGGFGFSKELLKRFKPEYASFPTTNSEHTLGEGQSIIESIGGELIDMDQVQIHPTGFIKQDDRDNNSKFLAAESLRGVGGILLNQDFQRFVNELDTRDVVSQAILKQKGGKSWLVLDEDMYKDFQFQIDFYQKMNLFMRKLVSDFNDSLLASLQKYSVEEKDEYGRDYKQHSFQNITRDSIIYVAEVTPVVHFTMGGVKIGINGNVEGFDGLYAVGEIAGGVHGGNRLAGNSLLECAVFGKRAADCIISS